MSLNVQFAGPAELSKTAIDVSHRMTAAGKAKAKAAAAPSAPPPARQWPRSPDDADRLLKRARAYVQTMPGAVSGQGGHDQTFKTACTLVLGFDLSINDALPIFREWNWTCSPPWSDADLTRKLAEADKQPGPRGRLRDADRNAWSAALDAELAELRGAVIVESPAAARPPHPIPAKPPTRPQPADPLADLAAFVPTPTEEELYSVVNDAYWDLDAHPCERPEYLGLQITSDGSPHERVKRCGHCVGCVAFRNWRAVRVLVNHMKWATLAGRGLYLLETTAAEWEHDRKQIDNYSPGGELDGYCHFVGRFAISTSAVGNEITLEAAVERIKQALTTLTRRPHAKDYTTSRSWELPKKPKREPCCVFVAYLKPISAEEREEIAENCGATISVKALPDGPDGDAIRSYSYRREVWTKDIREYFWAQRRPGVAFPRVEMVLIEPEQDRDREYEPGINASPLEADLQLTC